MTSKKLVGGACMEYEKLDKPILLEIEVGDKYGDGHSKWCPERFYVNYPKSVLQDAYKKSCSLMGVQFNEYEKYTDGEVLLCDYSDYWLSYSAVNALRRYGVLSKEFMNEKGLSLVGLRLPIYDSHVFALILMRFIGASMPKDFEYSEFAVKCESFNDDWGGHYHHSFGYGIYD